jgi:hypothetical protein
VGGWRKCSDSVSEGGTTTTTSEETREEGQQCEDDFFRRFHVTVVKTRTESPSLSSPPPPSDQDSPLSMTLGVGGVKKSVRFHKYDEVWNGGSRNFVYSLYDREQQEEIEHRDLVDELDGVVGNMSHFFRCIKEGIEDVTNKNPRRSPPLRSRSPSFSDEDEESYQSYNDDEDDSEIEESSL